MNTQPPPLGPPDSMPPVQSQADLQRLWEALMGPLRFGTRSLWLHVLDEAGRPTPLILQIEDIPARPDRVDLDRLADMCRLLASEESPNVVFLLTRPGSRGVTDDERTWARGLREVVARVGLHPWPVHCADDHALRVCAPDDLATSA